MQFADWVLQRLPSLQGLPEGKQQRRAQWLSLLSAVLKLLSAPSKLVGARGSNATEEASIGCIARKLKLQVVTTAVRLLAGAAGGFGRPCLQHCLLRAVHKQAKAHRGRSQAVERMVKNPTGCPSPEANNRCPCLVTNHTPKSRPLAGSMAHGRCPAAQQVWLALPHITADHCMLTPGQQTQVSSCGLQHEMAGALLSKFYSQQKDDIAFQEASSLYMLKPEARADMLKWMLLAAVQSQGGTLKAGDFSALLGGRIRLSDALVAAR